MTIIKFPGTDSVEGSNNTPMVTIGCPDCNGLLVALVGVEDEYRGKVYGYCQTCCSGHSMAELEASLLALVEEEKE